MIRLAVLLLALAGDPSFEGVTWVDGAPELKGKVVLVRWWTNGCHYCSDSAPVLAALAKKAEVVAVYHPKPPRDVTPEAVREAAKAIGLPGRLAIDRDWKVLERWKAGEKYDFTSLTFLLDRKGAVRFVHKGGTITKDDGEDLSRRIDALLAEK
jgi:thiol-disulfide isomerase/thioredoxin